MANLVADVGGTNTRLAITDGAGRLQRIESFVNRDFAAFEDVLNAYLADEPHPGFEGASIAVAGPVRPEAAELTNIGWVIDARRTGAVLGLDGVKPILVNDLAALGLALDVLRPDQLLQIRSRAGHENGQAMVFGLGTGCNLCINAGGRVIAAEQGHASLPTRVRDMLAASLGSAADRFPTVEHLFAGPGFSALDAAVTGGAARDGRDIVAEGDSETLALTGRLLGTFLRELVFQYMPMNGIHFSGSVARGLMGTCARDEMLRSFQAEGAFSELMDQVPLRMIVDDAAALYGLAHILNQGANAG